jgi:peptidoglycan/LPS O-acetylase OafA/YrhL
VSGPRARLAGRPGRAKDRLESLAKVGEDAPAAGGRFIAGDPLRGLAALGVAFYHLGAGTLFYRAGRQATIPVSDAYGWPIGPLVAHLDLGVYVFFVLSGYLIGRPFIRAFVAGDRPPAVGRFVRNRVLRIVPPFWGVLTIVLLITGTVGASGAEVAAVYGFAIAYDFNPLFVVMTHSWTLGVEMAFYLLVPVLAVGGAVSVGRRGSALARLLLVLAGAAALGVASFLLAAQRPDDREWQHQAQCALLAFTPGVLLAAMEISVEPRMRGRRLGTRLAPALLAAGAAVLYLGTRPRIDNVALEAAAATLGAGLLVAAPMVLQWSTGRCWRVLDNRATRWLGERSYSLYLVHVAVLYHLRSLGTDASSLNRGFAVTLVVAAPVVLAATIASHRLFETPYRRLRRPWRSHSAASAAKAAKTSGSTR